MTIQIWNGHLHQIRYKHLDNMGSSPSTRRNQQNMTNSNVRSSSSASHSYSRPAQLFPKCAHCDSRIIFGNRQCAHCNREYCSECWEQEHPSQPARSSEPHGQSLSWCRACTTLYGPMKNFNDLILLRAAELREFLERNDISTAQCRSKEELVDLILERFPQQSRLCPLATSHNADVERMAVCISFSHWKQVFLDLQ